MPDNLLDEARLRELAEAAGGCKWRIGGGGYLVTDDADPKVVADFLAQPDDEDYKSAPTLSEGLSRGRFCEAANPATILALLDALSAERERADRAVEHLRAMSHVAPRAFEVEAAFAFLATQKAEGT